MKPSRYRSDVTWTSWPLKSPETRPFIQKFAQAKHSEASEIALLALCGGNPLVHMTSNAESVSRSPRHNMFVVHPQWLQIANSLTTMKIDDLIVNN